jgi:hypothetical protein
MEFVPNRVKELGKEMGLSEEEMGDFLVVRRGGEGGWALVNFLSRRGAYFYFTGIDDAVTSVPR